MHSNYGRPSTPAPDQYEGAPRPRRHRRLGRIFGVRRRTLLGGTALGTVLLAVLTLIGVLLAKPGERPLPAATQPPVSIVTATQPQLQAALLRPSDLPTDFRSTTSRVIRKSAQTESCSALLADPQELLRTATAGMVVAPTATAQAVSEHTGPARSVLSQVLTTFAGDGAVAAFDELRRMVRGCRSFRTELADGRKVQVRVTEEPLPEQHPLSRLTTQARTVKLTITGSGGTTINYLAIGRVGKVLSVLGQSGTESAAPIVDPFALLNSTLSRLTRPTG